MNDKGFAISSVLYLLLVTFLMFLMLSMAQFSGATSVIAHANDDLTDGEVLSLNQVCINGNSKNVQIKNTTGKILYYPNDFSGCAVDSDCSNITNGKVTVNYTSFDKKLIVTIDGESRDITINDTANCVTTEVVNPPTPEPEAVGGEGGSEEATGEGESKSEG